MIAFPGARAAAIQLMRDENPDDQINSDEDDDDNEDLDYTGVADIEYEEEFVGGFLTLAYKEHWRSPT